MGDEWFGGGGVVPPPYLFSVEILTYRPVLVGSSSLYFEKRCYVPKWCVYYTRHILLVILFVIRYTRLILLGLFKVTGVTQVKKGDEGNLKIAVYRQPVVTAVDASHSSFQLYRSGVYYEPRCSSTRLDHALLVVGYGTLEGKDFWIAKNSWGWFLYI